MYSFLFNMFYERRNHKTYLVQHEKYFNLDKNNLTASTSIMKLSFFLYLQIYSETDLIRFISVLRPPRVLTKKIGFRPLDDASF